MNKDIRRSKKEDIPQIKKLWTDSFTEDTIAFVNNFFNNFFDVNSCFVIAQDDGEISAMIHYNVSNIQKNTSPTSFEKIAMIYGVATNPTYRKQGLMSRLINHIIHDVFREEQLDNIYIQAYNWDLYRKYGFSETFFENSWLIKASSEQKNFFKEVKKEDQKYILGLYKYFAKQAEGFKILSISDIDNLIMEQNLLNNKCYLSENTFFVLDKKNRITIIFFNSLDKAINELIMFASFKKQDMLLKLPSQFNMTKEITQRDKNNNYIMAFRKSSFEKIIFPDWR